MKNLLLSLTCFVTLNSYAQTNEAFTQEKSSSWIRISEDAVTSTKPATVKKQSTASVKRNTVTKKPSTPKTNTQQEFEKTNSQVNRFKKKKS